MVTVGPLLTQPDSEEDYSEIMEWLSKKIHFSTVFIFFGSENYLSKDQIKEMCRDERFVILTLYQLLDFLFGVPYR